MTAVLSLLCVLTGGFIVTYAMQTAIRTLDLTAVDLAGAEIQTFPLDQPQTFIDLSAS